MYTLQFFRLIKLSSDMKFHIFCLITFHKVHSNFLRSLTCKNSEASYEYFMHELTLVTFLCPIKLQTNTFMSTWMHILHILFLQIAIICRILLVYGMLTVFVFWLPTSILYLCLKKCKCRNKIFLYVLSVKEQHNHYWQFLSSLLRQNMKKETIFLIYTY